MSANADTGEVDGSAGGHGSRTGVEPPRLGFGTSALMSRVNRRDSDRLLQTALDAGITHFDTARSYGFGEAEIAVGDALAGRRDQVTVTTKVGILPPRRTLGLTTAKAMARGLLRLVPGARAQVRQRAGGLVRTERFDTASMADSLHTSLRRLRTEYVDFLLLHEPSCAVLATREPLAFLERVQQEGKVRRFGLAATPEVAALALNQAVEYAAVLQLPNSVFTPQLPLPTLPSSGVVFTHSALGTRFDMLRAQLQRDAEMAKHWSEILGSDVTEPAQLVRLCLQYAMAAIPQVTVVFTSTKPDHVRVNAAVRREAPRAEQIAEFRRLVWGMAGPAG